MASSEALDSMSEGHPTETQEATGSNSRPTRQSRPKKRSHSRASTRHKNKRSKSDKGKHHRQPRKERQQHKKRRSRRTRSPSTRSSDSSSSGESTIIGYSSASSSESENSDIYNFNPPQSAFGAHIGANVSKKMIKRIMNNEFIDLSKLLPIQYSSNSQSDELELTVDSKNNTCFKKKKEYENTPFFNVERSLRHFQLIYINTHPCKSIRDLTALTRDFLTYRKHIIDIVKQGGD